MRLILYFNYFKKKHNEKYDIPRLRLWARMVTSGWHESTDEPPDILVFCGDGLKKKKTMVEAIGGVMDALTKIVEQKAPGPPNTLAKPDIPIICWCIPIKSSRITYEEL